MTPEAQNEIRTTASELLRQGQQKDARGLLPVAAQVARTFGVAGDEVAILARTKDSRYLRFLFPVHLQSVGQIPLSSATSVASRTARGKRAEMENHLPVVPHA